MKRGSEHGVKMEPRSRKESPELNLDAMKASTENMQKRKTTTTKVKAKSPPKPAKAREPGLDALNKGKT